MQLIYLFRNRECNVIPFIRSNVFQNDVCIYNKARRGGLNSTEGARRDI